MAEKIQPSADPTATRYAIAWDIVFNSKTSINSMQPVEVAKLVHEVAKILMSGDKK